MKKGIVVTADTRLRILTIIRRRDRGNVSSTVVIVLSVAFVTVGTDFGSIYRVKREQKEIDTIKIKVCLVSERLL